MRTPKAWLKVIKGEANSLVLLVLSSNLIISLTCLLHTQHLPSSPFPQPLIPSIPTFKMAASRTVVVHETRAEMTKLGAYNLVVGQEFKDARGVSRSNVIWKSWTLGPKITIQWNVKYALQWTETLPANRAKKGTGTPGSISITNNAYSMGVHVIVGLFDEDTQAYAPAFIDPNELLRNGSGTYTPTEITRFWYEVEAAKGSFVSHDITSYGQIITSKPNANTDQFVWEGSYDPTQGKWSGDIKDVHHG
ncbi:unnamed protein product [Tilletia controversa]|nr:unnamed protein product [Tilletia controversa]CAD6919035.1 unnamed protein product [Tilletia controversa]CAD6962147.1 unnamed protein product [Tilletia controversa]